MRVYEVQNVEENRLDLFIARTMHEYTTKFKKYILYFNPSIDVLRIKAGEKIKVPSVSEMDSVPSLRFFVDGILRL